MDFQDELLTVAELAVGIAGFSAIVAAFSRRGEYHEADIARFRVLFSAAAAAVALAFVPSLLSNSGFSGQSLWRIASTIMIAAWFMQVIPGLLRVRKYLHEAPTGEGPTRSILLAIYVPSAVNLILQVLNASAAVWSPTGVAYLLGTLVYLWCSATAFYDLMVNRPAAQQGVEPDVK